MLTPPDISVCRQLAHTLRRGTGPIPETMRPLLAELLLQCALILEEVPKVNRATVRLADAVMEAQASAELQLATDKP